MSRVTRFAGRDPGPSSRVTGFLAHLRAHGLRLGVGETEQALTVLTFIEPANPNATRGALKAICTGCKEEFERFDQLFDSYWLDAGRVRQKVTPNNTPSRSDGIRSNKIAEGATAGEAGTPSTPDADQGEAEGDGTGMLIATRTKNLHRKDLRDVVQPDDIAAAERLAERIGAALRDRRSRRRKAARKGDRLHFRRILRRSLSTGGEPIRLYRKVRPDRTRKIAAICDVSGSMSVYAQVFLAFLAGLMRTDPKADAYLFHTRLVRITEALRDKDQLRAIGRMSLMADGFGGGSKIGASLERFAKTYAKRFVDGRTVVLILSDGYDSDPSEHLSNALKRLRKRGCRIIWLNPLKGWRDYAPVAAGMAAALPHLDLFAPANTLDDLAALEPELTRL